MCHGWAPDLDNDLPRSKSILKGTLPLDRELARLRFFGNLIA